MLAKIFERRIIPTNFMVDAWFIGGLLLCGFLGAVSGLVAGYVGTLGLAARCRSLEFDVASLEERLLREIKSRASALGVKAKKDDSDLIELLQKTPPKKPEPWYTQFVHPDLRGS